MTPFAYRRARSVADALAWLREDPDAKLLAGGQSLLAAMRLGLSAPSLLIDLQDLPQLQGLRQDGPQLWLGAMCSHARAASAPLLHQHAPALAQLAGGIADSQVRSRGTLGGSLSNADPAACWSAGMLAFGATICTDRRELAADDFFTGLFCTALEPDELLLGVRVAPAAQACYLKFEQPASRFALTGVAVCRRERSVRVAITGLGSGVCRWPAAELGLARRFEPQTIDGLLPDADQANGDIHASAEYRLHLAQVLARRAVQQIVQGGARA